MLYMGSATPSPRSSSTSTLSGSTETQSLPC